MFERRSGPKSPPMWWNGPLLNSLLVLPYEKYHGTSTSTVPHYVASLWSQGIKVDEDIITGYDRLSKLKCVFPLQMENGLARHIIHLSNQFHGLSVEKCRALDFEFAKKNAILVPANWERENKAGKDWFYWFKGRHKLAVRAPEPLARATAFNRHNVDQFYNNLAAVMDRCEFSASDIWNLNETGCATVQNPGKVVTEKGKKQVGSLTSAERGELMTLEYCVNAVGNVIPPLFVFPRVKFREHFLNGVPAGSIGRASRTGWMNEDLFVDYMLHFIQHTRCTKERPVLLILDNVEAHITIKTTDLARENGVVLLTLPPHTSHRLQPLGRAIYGPFKRAYNAAMDGWIRVSSWENSYHLQHSHHCFWISALCHVTTQYQGRICSHWHLSLQ